MGPESSRRDRPVRTAVLETRIREAMERIAAARGGFLQELATGAGASALQAEVLLILLNRPLVTPTTGSLARECRVRDSTMSDALASLARKGLVATEVNLQDKRVHTHRLTADGRRTARALRRQYSRFDNALAALPPEDKQSLLRLLLSAIEALWHAGVITVDRSCATCRFHKDDPRSPAGFCDLLGQILTPATLRTECAEHEPCASGGLAG